jgi:hypothetical protein
VARRVDESVRLVAALAGAVTSLKTVDATERVTVICNAVVRSEVAKAPAGSSLLEDVVQRGGGGRFLVTDTELLAPHSREVELGR